MTIIKTLLIDNYCSYTFNLFQLIAEVNGELPTVLRNDEVDWRTLEARLEAGEFHNIVISPGPGTPERPADIGVVMDLLRAEVPIPILGVCLGFQALALAHGGRVTHAPEPVHGRLSGVEHDGHPLFDGIPSGPEFAVVRYHSLLVEEASLPACLQGIGWTCGGHHALQLEAAQQGAQLADSSADPAAAGTAGAGAGIAAAGGEQGGSNGGLGAGQAGGAGQRLLMALAHRRLPHWGVQFHPESVATRYGLALLRNFAAMSCAHHGLPPPGVPPSLLGKLAGQPGAALPPRPWDQPGNLCLHHRHLPRMLAACGGSEDLFWNLFGSTQQAEGDSVNGSQDGSGGGLAPDTFWLDSATTDRGRFSFMGGRGGSLWRRIVYRLPPPAPAEAAGNSSAPADASSPQQQQQQQEQANGAKQQSQGHCSSTDAAPVARPGTLTLVSADGSQQHITTDFFGWLQRLLESHRCQVSPQDAAALPFNFWGGLVGYLGYELKAECGGRQAHAAATPDAAFLLADQLLAVDHRTDSVYVLALSEAGSEGGRLEAECWVEQTVARVQALAAARAAAPAASGLLGSLQQQGRQGSGLAPSDAAVRGAAEQLPSGSELQMERPGPFRLREGRQRYLANVGGCMQALYDGESYEVCLTTMMSRQGAPQPRQLYTTLRRVNPAPYAAWLRLGAGDVQLCCCSPERFLKGDRGGLLEAKPIKGTAPRSSDPRQDAASAAQLAASEKDRAENLMIVDLLRNDLGRVCQRGSVHVPVLMHIESYATVHQMVSTVRGLRRPGATTVDCLRAAFPGGSMTGAPKIRTMAIIDRLEQGPRGVYSGSLGYISFNDTFDLNIVIRTAIITPTPAPAHDGGSEGHAPNGIPGGIKGSRISIGAGGAIVVQSDPEGEYEEMLLKARALLRAIGECDGGDGPAAVAED